MENTIVREFMGNPSVVTVLFNQGGSQGETLSWLQTFWDNYYLRGQVLFDETGQIGAGEYGQPSTGLPFGRGFIIDADGRVDWPYFGHQPDAAIARIYELLGVVDAGEPASVPTVARLDAWVRPNPTRSRAAIEYTMGAPGRIRLEIYDVRGRPIRTLTEVLHAEAGSYRVTWDGDDHLGRSAPAGVYFARVTTDGIQVTRRLTLLR